MSEGYHALTEKEKQTLRLIVRGHDAKSAARHFGLSVHTVNERLRDARRKLSVSSSREAARLVLAAEGGAPDFVTDKPLGDAEPTAGMRPSDGRATKWRWAWTVGGVLIMSLVLAMLALNSLSQVAPPPAARDEATAATAVTDTEAVRSTQAWLLLVDAGRWDESWNATGQAFKKLNTGRTWATVSEKVRPPLGAVVSRAVSSAEWLPAPPYGYQVVKFRTSFAAKPDTAETVTLVREGQDWKVVGYLIG